MELSKQKIKEICDTAVSCSRIQFCNIYEDYSKHEVEQVYYKVRELKGKVVNYSSVPELRAFAKETELILEDKNISSTPFTLTVEVPEGKQLKSAEEIISNVKPENRMSKIVGLHHGGYSPKFISEFLIKKKVLKKNFTEKEIIWCLKKKGLLSQ